MPIPPDKQSLVSLAAFNKISSGAGGVPPNRRDASNGSNSPWKTGVPNLIRTPANQPHANGRTQDAFVSRLQMLRGPFSGRMHDTLNRSPKAARTVLNIVKAKDTFARAKLQSDTPARKRQKIDGNTHNHQPEMSSKFFNSSETHFRKSPHHVIDLADDGDDIEQMGEQATRAGPSSRNERIMPGPFPSLLDDDYGPVPPVTRSSNQISHNENSRLSSSSSPDPLDGIARHDFDANVPRRQEQPDGNSTILMRQRLGKGKAKVEDIIDVDDDDADSIQSASGFPPSRPPPPPTPSIKQIPTRIVPTRVAALERTAMPTVDFADRSAKRMKGRPQKPPSTLSLEPIRGIETSTTPYISNASGKPAPARKKETAEKSLALPLEAWALGCQILGEEEPVFWIKYVPETAILQVTEGSGGHPYIAFNVKRDFENLMYTSVDSLTPSNVIIQAKVINGDRKKKSDMFQPGSKGSDGRVTFKLQTRHPNWTSENLYEELIKNIRKNNVHTETIFETAAQNCWRSVIDAALAKRMQLEDQPKRQTRQRNDTGDQPQSLSISAPPITTRPRPRPVPKPAFRGGASESTRITRQSMQEEQVLPQSEPDQLILVYPPTGTGALNIMTSDLNRLQPGQYLNDTLIEFGLKLWMDDLRKSNPDLAEQIHIFNSFFYKKINVKNKEDGYKSVRKWTSKFDLFEKKYIIVPINENLHWYLAIICNPEYILLPPPPEVPTFHMTRKRKRVSDLEQEPEVHLSSVPPAMSTTAEASTSPALRPVSPSHSDDDIVPDSGGEDEVESMLNLQSCSITDDTQPPTVQEEPSLGKGLPDLRYPDTPKEDEMDIDFSSPPIHDTNLRSRSETPEIMEISTPTVFIVNDDIDMLPESNTYNSDISKRDDISLIGVDDEPSVVETLSTTDSSSKTTSRRSSGIPPALFYGSKAASRKVEEEARLPDIENNQQIEETEEAGPSESVGSTELSQPRTYIFTFDSLGSRHPQAIKTLAKYLEMEAKAKKHGIEEITPPEGKQALVPVQPNYCDCGVYLLHYVRTFMQDPDRAVHIIHTRRGRGLSTAERAEDWNGRAISGLREELTTRTQKLSREWQTDRAAREEEKKKDRENDTDKHKPNGQGSASALGVPDAVVVIESDDEVVIEDGPNPPAQIGSSKPRTYKSKAVRLR